MADIFRHILGQEQIHKPHFLRAVRLQDRTQHQEVQARGPGEAEQHRWVPFLYLVECSFCGRGGEG